MIISIAGPPGSGKSTVAMMLAKKLGFKRYYMGGLMREAARKRHLSLEEYYRLGEDDPHIDLEVDLYQKELGEQEDDFVIEGRTSFYFIPHSIKVFLDVQFEEGARRIMRDDHQSERNEKRASTIAQKVLQIKDRIAAESRHYAKHFGIDCYDKSNFDLVIDTTDKSPGVVVSKILDFLEESG